MVMTQDERWQKRYEEVKAFIETNHRNPSKHDEEERGKYINWIKANRIDAKISMNRDMM